MTMITLKDLANDADFSDSEKNFNVADEYAWTLTPPSQRLSEPPPRIVLTEYEQDLSTLYAQLFYWYGQVKSMAKEGLADTGNPYADLYHANRTGVVFTLPYFQEYDHMISQSWEQTKGLMDFPVAEKILNLAAAAAKMFQLAPGTSVNQPRVWSGGSAASYNVRFLLFNTFTKEDANRNIVFKRRLLMSTLHDQRTALLASPPAIFAVLIPGVRYSPAAVISQLSVTNVGQMNMIKGLVVPDAWMFDIQITELITESRQLLKDVKDQKITAFTTADTAEINAAAEAGAPPEDAAPTPPPPPPAPEYDISKKMARYGTP